MYLFARVLAAFYKLHRTRKQVFEGDDYALNDFIYFGQDFVIFHSADSAREKINSEFRKHMNETDSEKIKELLVIAEDADRILRTAVVQAKLTDEGTYRIKVTKDTHLEDNILFREDAEIPTKPGRKKCSDS